MLVAKRLGPTLLFLSYSLDLVHGFIIFFSFADVTTLLVDKVLALIETMLVYRTAS